MVEWCLVLTTKEEAMLTVVAKSSPALGAPWVVVPTRFIVPSDWVSFLCVGASKSGRIFLGGQDGNLYELDYNMMVKPSSDNYSNTTHGFGPSDAVHQQLDRFYNGGDDVSKGPKDATTCPDVLHDDKSLPSPVEYLKGFGKRALDVAFSNHRIGTNPSLSTSDTLAPPRKCRKLNHSNNSEGLWKRVLPDFVTQVQHLVFGDTSSSAGGPITQVVVDDERQLLYTLSAPKGWICVFDMQTKSSTSSILSSSSSTLNEMQSSSLQHNQASDQLVLAAVLDTPSTARSYLESVGRGRLNPTSTISSSREGKLTFLGNAEAAQAGVGGMEGARRILRQLESSKTNNNNTYRRDGRARRNGRDTAINILTPISIQVIPCRESTRITLIAVTAGGLRYYLSTLDSRSIGTGPPPPSRSGNNPWKPPGNRMTLYHIRAPPPLDSPSGNLNGVAPATLKNLRVDASCYHHGTWLVAFEPTPTGSSSSRDTLIAVSQYCSKIFPSNALSDIPYPEQGDSPGGICELVSLDLSKAGGMDGGRVWDVGPGTLFHSKLLALTIQN
jgi:nuclear pore complex protein Nup155